MIARHLELLVEEPSMEVFLRELLPRILSADCDFEIHPFQGKLNLLGNLENRLKRQLVNRVVIEELEAWYFGDWEAVRSAYPRVSPTVPNQSRYRNPDSVQGGTWEAFERILKGHGYFRTGLTQDGSSADRCRLY